MDQHVGLGVSVSVVVERLAERAQRLDARLVQAERNGEFERRPAQAVAEGGNDRPAAEAPAEMAVDEDARARRRRRIDVQFEPRMRR
jgi:hypothetical protein